MSQLKISLEFDNTFSDDVDSYSRGNITVEGEYGTISSFGQSPDQSMMIFISIVDLLDGVHNLITNDKISEFFFVGADCSFQFTVKKHRKKVFIKDKRKKLIGTMKTQKFVQILWREIKMFTNSYPEIFNEEEIIYNDLIYSIKRFKQEFNL